MTKRSFENYVFVCLWFCDRVLIHHQTKEDLKTGYQAEVVVFNIDVLPREASRQSLKSCTSCSCK